MISSPRPKGRSAATRNTRPIQSLRRNFQHCPAELNPGSGLCDTTSGHSLGLILWLQSKALGIIVNHRRRCETGEGDRMRSLCHVRTWERARCYKIYERRFIGRSQGCFISLLCILAVQLGSLRVIPMLLAVCSAYCAYCSPYFCSYYSSQKSRSDLGPAKKTRLENGSATCSSSQLEATWSNNFPRAQVSRYLTH